MLVLAEWDATTPAAEELKITLGWDEEWKLNASGASPQEIVVPAPLPAGEYVVGAWATGFALSAEQQVHFVVMTRYSDPQP